MTESALFFRRILGVVTIRLITYQTNHLLRTCQTVWCDSAGVGRCVAVEGRWRPMRWQDAHKVIWIMFSEGSAACA
jgi:hypothetical protein